MAGGNGQADFEAGDHLVVTDLARSDRAEVSEMPGALVVALKGSNDRAPTPCDVGVLVRGSRIDHKPARTARTAKA